MGLNDPFSLGCYSYLVVEGLSLFERLFIFLWLINLYHHGVFFALRAYTYFNDGVVVFFFGIGGFVGVKELLFATDWR